MRSDEILLVVAAAAALAALAATFAALWSGARAGALYALAAAGALGAVALAALDRLDIAAALAMTAGALALAGLAASGLLGPQKKGKRRVGMMVATGLALGVAGALAADPALPSGFSTAGARSIPLALPLALGATALVAAGLWLAAARGERSLFGRGGAHE